MKRKKSLGMEEIRITYFVLLLYMRKKEIPSFHPISNKFMESFLLDILIYFEIHISVTRYESLFSFCMLYMRKKIPFLSFYPIYPHENEFSLV